MLKNKIFYLFILLLFLFSFKVEASENELADFFNYLSISSNIEESSTTLIPNYNINESNNSLEIVKLLSNEEVFIREVLNLAESKIGCEYSQARREKKDVYDCSSFVRRMYEEVTTIYIGNTTYDIPINLRKYEVDLEDIEPGDLLWRKGHIVMYIGDGQIIHASGENTGVVKDNLSDVKPFKKAFRPIDYIIDELEKQGINIDNIVKDYQYLYEEI